MPSRFKNQQPQITMLQTLRPFTTGIQSFDHHYGSHARGGDSWLVFSCSGGGKTTLACQTAGFSAKSGLRVLYITTKEPGVNILMHAYSAVSGIPYSVIKELKGSPNHPLASAFREWVANDGWRITIVEYRDPNRLGFEERYQQILDSFYATHGKTPDISILDQLNGVLLPPYADHIEKLEACNKVATIMSNTSKKLNNVAILLCHANSRCSNKFDLTENDTADSRSLCDRMTNVLGITSLSTHEVGAGPMMSCEQYLVICKCCEEPSMRIRVKARFEISRFEGWS